MRIRKNRNPPPTSTLTSPPPLSPPSPSSSPPSSTITAASSPSSSHSSSSSSSSSLTRCEGLDLLVKAIHHVSTTGGSLASVVPYIQRRSVVRRRRRRSDYLRFNHLFVTENMGIEEEREEGEGSLPEHKLKNQRRSRVMALPSKYQDSVLQPWRLRSRSAIKINE